MEAQPTGAELRDLDVGGSQEDFDAAMLAAQNTRVAALRAAVDQYALTATTAERQQQLAHAQVSLSHAQTVGPAKVTWVQGYGAAELTWVLARTAAHVASTTQLANLTADYNVQETAALSSSIAAFAAAYPTPWSLYTSDTVDAWRDKVAVTAPARAAYCFALATAAAAADVATTEAQNTLDEALAQAESDELIGAAQAATDYQSEAEPIYQTMVAAAGEAGYEQAHEDERGLPVALKSWIAMVALPGIGHAYAASELKEQYASSDSGVVDAFGGVSFVSAATGQEPPPPEPVPSAPASQEAAQKNPHPYGSMEWLDWKIARNGRLSVTSTLRDQNIQTAKEVKPILEATAELCASGVGGQAYLTAEVVSGQELATGRQLTPVERTIYGTLLTVPVLGGVAAKSLGAGLKWLRPFVGASDDAARALSAGARITTAAADVGSDLGGAVRSGRRLLDDVPGGARGGFGANGLYRAPTAMADEAVKAAYLKEVDSLAFRVKLGIHNLLTPFHKRTAVAAVREAVESGAFGRGSFTVKALDDGRKLFGGSGTRTFLNRQFFHHELIHASQMIKNPNLWSNPPLRMLHEPIQIFTAHGALGWPALGAGVWYAVNWWNE
jgi:hypothetical protein